MSITMNVHGASDIRARFNQVQDSKWVTLELSDNDGGRLFELTVFGDDEGFLRAIADQLNGAADLARKRLAEIIGEPA